MNTSKFNTLTKKANSIYMTDGTQEFPRVVVSVMESVHAWYSMRFAVKYTTENVDFYIVMANNGGYFKTDGQERCINFFVHDKKTEQCWLGGCMCPFSEKEVVEYIERYVRDVEGFDLSTVAEIGAKKRKEYPWQISCTINDKTSTFEQHKKDQLGKTNIFKLHF